MDWEQLVAAFNAGTLDASQWNHRMHIAVAIWHLLKYGSVAAGLCYLKPRLIGTNIRLGFENSTTKGYHETLTRLWLGAVGAYLATLPPACTRVEAARLAWREFSERRSLFKEWYSYDLVTSVQARATWQPPDRPRHLVESLRPDPR